MTNRVIENWRNQYPESAFWETEAGAAWLKRLVIAVLYSFGMECHVGADKLATFFKLTWAEGMTRQFHRSSSAYRILMSVWAICCKKVSKSFCCSGKNIRRKLIGNTPNTQMTSALR